MEHYTSWVDKAMGANIYTHRTLRTCFDPGSSEWDQTDMKKKLEILRKVLSQGYDLNRILLQYKIAYKEMKKDHVVFNIQDGLATLLEYALFEKEIENK